MPREAIGIKPDFAPAHFQRAAAAYTKENSFELARADLDVVLKLIPQQPTLDAKQLEAPALALYVETYESQAGKDIYARQWSKAVEGLRKAVAKQKEAVPIEKGSVERLERKLARAYQAWGVDCVAARKWDDAIRCFEEARQLDKSLASELDPQRARGLRRAGIRLCQPP